MEQLPHNCAVSVQNNSDSAGLGFGPVRVDEAARISADGFGGSHEHVDSTIETAELKASQDGAADTNSGLVEPPFGNTGPGRM